MTNLVVQAETFASKLLTLADKGVDLTLQQAPIVVQELIWRDRVYMTAVVIIPALLFLVAMACVARGCKHGFWNDETPKPIFLMAIAAGMVWFGSLLVMAVPGQLKRLVTVWTAPRLHVVEWCKEQVK
jgi:hypothetical protein